MEVSIDISKTTKLKEIKIELDGPSVLWITTALKTVTPRHRDLQQISIKAPPFATPATVSADIRQVIGEEICREWTDLDQLLAHLGELHGIRTKVTYMPVGTMNIREGIIGLLGETTRRGFVELIKLDYSVHTILDAL